jgi:hypothetical protein
LVPPDNDDPHTVQGAGSRKAIAPERYVRSGDAGVMIETFLKAA